MNPFIIAILIFFRAIAYFPVPLLRSNCSKFECKISDGCEYVALSVLEYVVAHTHVRI